MARSKALAGAITATLSPGRSAGGRITGVEGTTPILNEEFAPADDLRRAAQEHLAFPANGLRTPFRVHLHRRLHPPRNNGGDRRGARSRSRRLGLARAALKKARLDTVLILHTNELDVGAGLEVVMPSDLGGFCLPSSLEAVHEHDKMWIARRHWNTRDITECQPDSERLAVLRFAHRC